MYDVVSFNAVLVLSKVSVCFCVLRSSKRCINLYFVNQEANAQWRWLAVEMKEN